MNKPDPVEVLNEEMIHLVDTMKHEIETVGKLYDLNADQISEMEKDFIARLAFSAIMIGNKKEEEEECENCPAKDHCSFKEPEKKEDYSIENTRETIKYIHNYCKSCKDCTICPYMKDSYCRLLGRPELWEV